MCVVVKTIHDDQDHLVAYVEGQGCREDELRRHCSSRLPLHMVPSFFVVMEKLPLNQNGKIDRKKLPAIDFSAHVRSMNDDGHEVVWTEMERRVWNIWHDVLPHVESVTSPLTSFFSLGGNSLLMMRMFRLYRQQMSLDDQLSMINFFQQPSIREHANLLMNHQESLFSKCDGYISVSNDAW